MLKNHFRIAVRSLWRQKGYSFINIVGLGIGMACALFILLWVQDELRFDGSMPTPKRSIGRAGPGGRAGEIPRQRDALSDGAGLISEVPEVKDSTRFAFPGTLLVRHEDKVFFEGRYRPLIPRFFKCSAFP
jgi:putative ABC transport system permease protein